MHLSVKVPIEYPIKAIHIKVNSTIQAAKVEYTSNPLRSFTFSNGCVQCGHFKMAALEK